MSQLYAKYDPASSHGSCVQPFFSVQRSIADAFTDSSTAAMCVCCAPSPRNASWHAPRSPCPGSEKEVGEHCIDLNSSMILVISSLTMRCPPLARWALLRNQVTDLIKHERIQTTVAKAKEVFNQVFDIAFDVRSFLFWLISGCSDSLLFLSYDGSRTRW